MWDGGLTDRWADRIDGTKTWKDENDGKELIDYMLFYYLQSIAMAFHGHTEAGHERRNEILYKRRTQKMRREESSAFASR